MTAKGQTEQKLDSYLTEMKELPPLGEEVSQTEVPNKAKQPKVKTLLPRTESEVKIDQEEKDFGEGETKSFEEDFTSEGQGGEGRKLPITSRDILLGIVNLVSVILLIIILLRFPTRASELKNLRAEDLRNQSNVSYEVFEVDSYRQRARQLEALFLDESGVVEFIGQVEKVAKVSFSSQKAVKDKTGNLGLPVIFEFSGDWEEVDRTIQAIDKLPFLFRVVKVEVRKSPQDTNVIQSKYGIMLYVKDEFGEN